MTIVSCVGSLTSVRLRFANQHRATRLNGHFEILSLVGTLAPKGRHLHLCIGDDAGRVTGGHLLGDGSAVYTTAEIVPLTLPGLRFSRGHCPQSGHDELTIGPAILS